jgi:uncharacterized protein YozE (UPF0346 family)
MVEVNSAAYFLDILNELGSSFTEIPTILDIFDRTLAGDYVYEESFPDSSEPDLEDIDEDEELGNLVFEALYKLATDDFDEKSALINFNAEYLQKLLDQLDRFAKYSKRSDRDIDLARSKVNANLILANKGRDST